MLLNVLPEITRFCEIMSLVTGVDIEIVDAGLTRLAGTGVYADKIGLSLEAPGGLYHQALARGSALYVENPREDELCRNCPNKGNCRELLNFCTPIILKGRALGVIGLVCFTEADRSRVLAQKAVFAAFVVQIAGAISNAVAGEQHSRRVSRKLDILLQVTDSNTRSVLMLGREGRVSYANETARREFGLGDAHSLDAAVRVRATGNTISDMEEFEVRVGGVEHVAFGRFLRLDAGDDDFAEVLLTEPLPRLAEMMSLFGASGQPAGALSSIIGEGRAMGRLKQRVRQIARTSSTVLITGESGTGKEMFARAIHAESDRRDKPFIAINCGAIPDALLESELFGYVSGAFTGAAKSGRVGKFELAQSGVLFLDEIGSMSLYLQVKLLRVLQERTFTRLGSNRLITVDVRIIAATNEDLHSLIEQKLFRDDLFYRLSVIPLELSPLRERKEDIPLLAEFFLNRYCTRFGKPPARLSPDMLGMLRGYGWPGNVREFENCIEYMVNMHTGGPLSNPALLPPKIRSAVGRAAAEREQTDAQTGAAGALPEEGNKAEVSPVIPLEELTRQAIQNALRHYGDSAAGKKKAAEALGIGIATLYRKLSP